MTTYYPKQIPYLLDQDFRERVDYQEHHFTELDKACFCLWTMRSRATLAGEVTNYILPDACIDLVIDFTKQTINFAGFSKATEPFPLTGEIDYLGARLKPSVFYALFGVAAQKVVDRELPFSAVEQNFNLADIFRYTNNHDRSTCLKSYLLAKLQTHPTFPYFQVIDELYQAPTPQTVTTLAQSLNCSNGRSLYRLFMTQFGVSPKTLLNILRLHFALTLILEQQKSLVDIANLCGFYDQAHFNKELKKYTNITPSQVLDNYGK